MRTAVLITMICWFVFGALATVALIGEPRKPVTPSIAIRTLITQALICVGAFYLFVSAS